jgi:HK97 family phage portal protein
MITSITGGGSIERPGSTLGDFLQVFGIGDVLRRVDPRRRLQVPAVSAAVSFLSRTLAALPLHAYRKTADGAKKIDGRAADAGPRGAEPEWTSFKLRAVLLAAGTFTGGRGLLWIERSGSNIVGIWPMDPPEPRIVNDLGAPLPLDGKEYPAADVIDVPFMLKADAASQHYSPIVLGAKAIQLALAMDDMARVLRRRRRSAAGAGRPLPAGPEAMKRAQADVQRGDRRAQGERQAHRSTIPPGYELKPIGIDPDKGQMTEARRFQVEEIARIYSLPPVFLQDLTHGTFSNTEQQDLFFVKHLVGQWAEALEQELNLKLFGQRNGGRYVEHNLDGLLRGDFKTRMDGLATSASRTPS